MYKINAGSVTIFFRNLFKILPGVRMTQNIYYHSLHLHGEKISPASITPKFEQKWEMLSIELSFKVIFTATDVCDAAQTAESYMNA